MAQAHAITTASWKNLKQAKQSVTSNITSIMIVILLHCKTFTMYLFDLIAYSFIKRICMLNRVWIDYNLINYLIDYCHGDQLSLFSQFISRLCDHYFVIKVNRAVNRLWFNRLLDWLLSWWSIITILSIYQQIMWSLLCGKSLSMLSTSIKRYQVTNV